MKKAAYAALTVIVVLSAVYMMGPTPPEPHLDPTPVTNTVPIDSLDNWIAKRESGFKTLKPGNGAEIVWYDDSLSVTEYAVVYLHGFSASKEEGNPVHRAFAKRYGCNLYLPRLYGHGLDTTEPLLDLTPENLLRSAKEAIAIGKTIGKKVIVMSTSTGGTLTIYLAAHDPDIDGLICYSPNIDIYDSNSKLITGPWGLQLLRQLMRGNYRTYETDAEFGRYWQTEYRIEALVALRSLIDHTMKPEVFKRIEQPIFIGAYFKDEENQDKVVSVEAMQRMMPQLGTEKGLKRMALFPNVGDHVMANPLRSKDVESVISETFTFAEQTLGMKAVIPLSRNATE